MEKIQSSLGLVPPSGQGESEESVVGYLLGSLTMILRYYWFYDDNNNNKKCRETMMPRKGEELDGISNSLLYSHLRGSLYIQTFFSLYISKLKKQVDNRTTIMQIKRLAYGFQVSTD